MKKKFFAVALATTMAISGSMTAFAAETKIDSTVLAADSYTEQANPLQGKNAEKVTISYTINWDAEAPRNGWDGVFAFYEESSGARVSFSTAPYLCYNQKDKTGTEDWIDLKADAWCSANCEAGKDYTFQYVITKDSITVSCDGTQIAEFSEVGRGDAAAAGYQSILDALNTYPTLTIGVGTAKSCYWNTEPCTISITIDDGAVAAGTNEDNNTNNSDNNNTNNNSNSNNNNQANNTNNSTNTNNQTPPTDDVAPIAFFAVFAVVACAAVIVSKKKVTE